MVSRRTLLKSSLALPFWWQIGALAQENLPPQEDYGVASGSPRPESVVLWTRLPDSVVAHLQGARAVVRFAVHTSMDCSPQSLVLQGAVATSPAQDYAVKALARGLSPDTVYYYFFHLDDLYVSRVGRTKTAPHPDTERDVSFALVSCQHFTNGFFTPYSHLLHENVDFCAHLGDHIYEREPSKRDRPDALGGRTAMNLEDYRAKYRHSLSDPGWRQVRAAFPWIDIWDDHEVFNNYAGPEVARRDPTRLTGAYQAFLEYMPVEAELTWQENNLPHVNLHSTFTFGRRLAGFALDSRQYRDVKRTMLGDDQTLWLSQELVATDAQWKLLFNPDMMAPLYLAHRETFADKIADKVFGDSRHDVGDVYLNLDQWDGFPEERQRLLDVVRMADVRNLVVCTGDLHMGLHSHLYPDPLKPQGSKPIAVEVVSASITSMSFGDTLGGTLSQLASGILRRSNPHTTWVDGNHHGYTIMTAKSASMDVRHVAVSTIKRQEATAATRKNVLIPDGIPTFLEK